MAKTLAAFACILILWGCEQAPDLEIVKSQLLEIDREFSQMSLEKGTDAAFLAYMAEDAVIHPYKGDPLEGRDTYQDLAHRLSESGIQRILQWEPHFSDAARSGDLGYTLGSYRSSLTNPDSSQEVTTGYYITVWKKQADGTWKFVFDGGNQN